MKFKSTWERIDAGISEVKYGQTKDRPALDLCLLTSYHRKSAMRLLRCATALNTQVYHRLKLSRRCLITVSILLQSRATIGFWKQKVSFIPEVVSEVDKGRPSQQVIRQQVPIRCTHGTLRTCHLWLRDSTITSTWLKISIAEKSLAMMSTNVNAVS